MAESPSTRAVEGLGGRAPLSCAQARVYLTELVGGTSTAGGDEVFSFLARHGAVAGTPERPTITVVGRQVLKELNLRAYRADPLPLNDVAAQISGQVLSLGQLAERAEYFIAELGPVPPVDVLPLLRVVGPSLASLPEEASDLVEEFRSAWGSMEVLGSTHADRVLAAELVTASRVPQESFYAPLMHTCDRLLGAGCRATLSTGSLLHLHPRLNREPPVEAWSTARRATGDDLAAALLAPWVDSGTALARWSELRRQLPGSDVDRSRAAAFLAAGPENATGDLERLRATAELWSSAFGYPALAAALATSHLSYAAPELADWLAKATDHAAARRLAPTSAELSVVGLGLLLGLHPSGGADSAPAPVAVSDLPARAVLNAWLFGGLRRTAPARSN